MQSDIIQTLWLGKPTRILNLCINSFLDAGHEVRLYCYEKLGTNARECDANEIIPEAEIIRRNLYKSVCDCSTFSEIFRYKLLLDRGGYWVDTDNVCLKKYDFDGDVFSSERHTNGLSGVHANVGVIRSEDKAFIQDLYLAAKGDGEKAVYWGQFGPKLMHAKLLEYGKFGLVKHPTTFCSIDYKDYRLFLDGPEIPETDDMYSVHLWNEGLRRSGIIEEEISSDCWLGRMFAKYNV